MDRHQNKNRRAFHAQTGTEVRKRGRILLFLAPVQALFLLGWWLVCCSPQAEAKTPRDYQTLQVFFEKEFDNQEQGQVISSLTLARAF